IYIKKEAREGLSPNVPKHSQAILELGYYRTALARSIITRSISVQTFRALRIPSGSIALFNFPKPKFNLCLRQIIESMFRLGSAGLRLVLHQPRNHVVEHRRQEDAEEGDADHAAEDGGAQRAAFPSRRRLRPPAGRRRR